MAATDGQIVIAAARWSTEDVLSLRDFLSQARSEESPRSELVKFVRGQFASLGVPNLPNPSLHSNAILTTLGKTLKVAAQSVKFKDGKRNGSVSSGIRFSIPESYPGYFEILSEEGKAVKCIESVSELTKKFPECVLVRENVRGFVTAIPLLELSADKSRTINAGEILTLQKEVSLTRSSRNHKFLQCTDSKGDIVYLNMEQRGKFSPIARNDNISGVHTLRQLVTNKRLPLMVRLVWGPPPFKGSGTAQPACSELRLFSTFEEDTLFALPLGQHSKDSSSGVVPLPSACNLKLVRARNHAELRQTEQFKRLASSASRLARDINSRMTVLETFKDSISFWNISPNHSKHIGAKISSKNYFLRRSVSHESQIVVSPIVQDETPSTEVVAPTQEFLEIDQIYDYVRGFAPLPKNLRTNNFEDDSLKAPQPPPIETIPTNKQHHHQQQQQQQHLSSTPIHEKKTRKIERQKIMKPSSKTALKMELHAQNLAQESLRSTDRARIEKQNKRLFKSKTTSSLADYIQLTALTESHVDGDKISVAEKPSIDLSSTHLLTQADLSPQPNTSEHSSLNEQDFSGDSLSPIWKSPDADLEPTYENTTQVYLECDTHHHGNEVNNSSSKKTKHLYQKQKATSEFAHRLRDGEISPNYSYYYNKKIINHNNESSIKQQIKKLQNNNNDGTNKTSKSHEDLVTKKQQPKIAQVNSQPESPTSEKPLHNSLTNLRSPNSSAAAAAESSERKARRRRLSKQRSLSSLLAEAAPNGTPVIEHRPVELHLHLSRPHAGHAAAASNTPRHHVRGSKTERGGKLGILYL